MLNILFIGDIVGGGGRDAVNALARPIMDEYGCAFCVANGENMAGGNGFTAKCVKELASSGVNVFTGGDHTWDQKEFPDEIGSLGNVLRPANVSSFQPGRGYGIFAAAGGVEVGVVSLLGRTFMNTHANCPYEAADRIVAELRQRTPFVIVDFHAEATSDKIAMGRMLDGKASAVLGTHTHVPTADEQIFPGGTAFQCDVGMVGARESVLGREINSIVGRYRTGMPTRFPVVNEGIRLNATMVSLDEQGRATAIQRIVRDFN